MKRSFRATLGQLALIVLATGCAFSDPETLLDEGVETTLDEDVGSTSAAVEAWSYWTSFWSQSNNQ